MDLEQLVKRGVSRIFSEKKLYPRLVDPQALFQRQDILL